MTATIVLWALTAILVAHTVVFRAATRWARKGWRVDIYDWQHSSANRLGVVLPTVTRPWYVRYADWLGRIVGRRPRVTGQVVVHLEVDIPPIFRTTPRPSPLSAHGLGRAVDLATHYSQAHWGMTGDAELRPGSSEGGIHPALYDAGGYLPVGQPLMNTTRHPESVLTAQQLDLVFTSMRNSFAEFAARISAAFNRLDVLAREIDPIYDRRRRREERLAAKNPELTALWTAYRHKTRRRNRRRRNR